MSAAVSATLKAVFELIEEQLLEFREGDPGLEEIRRAMAMGQTPRVVVNGGDPVQITCTLVSDLGIETVQVFDLRVSPKPHDGA
ncbi:MAG TPA: hypothetical protein VH040_16840 [Usitatibacter sp.]|jgi:hypothetical protein|nr:hypothetical protein [Usitatibacter sp.]